MSFKQYDIVRPSKQWYREKSKTFISCNFLDCNLLRQPTDEEIMKMQLEDIGIISEGTSRYYVKWISHNKNRLYQVHNAWWKDEELELIGNILNAK